MCKCFETELDSCYNFNVGHTFRRIRDSSAGCNFHIQVLIFIEGLKLNTFHFKHQRIFYPFSH